MSDKSKSEKPKSDTRSEKKTDETVHLSAEDLRKISGGGGGPAPPPIGKTTK